MLLRDQPTVAVDGFTGPFDLLVRLIERRQLSLLAIALAEVTDQYLASLTAANLRDPEHVTAFLVVAAKLLLIKSTLLLPARERTKSTDETMPDPTDLTERLRLYTAFRKAAEILGRRLDAGLRSYPHPPTRLRPSPRRPPGRLDPALLSEALRRALARPKETAPAELSAETRLSVGEAIELVRAALDRLNVVQLDALVGANSSRQQLVATFLAILELARLGAATVDQLERFGPIVVTKRVSSDPVENSASS
jgi:segregation and condensation protein A